VVAINDLASADILLHLLKFDSTHGRLSRLGVSAEVLDDNNNTQLCLTKNNLTYCIKMLSEADPKNLPWRTLGIDVVLECTGHFRSYEQAQLHIAAGAQQVIIGAAPFDNVDACIVMGVNTAELTRKLPIISSVSCTTQALVPLIDTLDKAFGVRSAMMTEIHAVTADQTVLDQAHRDPRRARASGYNIIPTTSSSIAATERVLPAMVGKINGHSIRVPTIDVAAIDVTFVFDTPDVSVDAIREKLRAASLGDLINIMAYTDEPLVSSDFIHQPESLIIDGQQLMQVGEQYKVFAWYDNEWGYANRLLDMCLHLALSK
jgi:glyceraldehyde 3-phosphate dehydrogenase